MNVPADNRWQTSPSRAWLRGLRWILEREPVGLFDSSGPPLFTVKRLAAAGLIERYGKEPGMFGVVRYRLTAQGHELLAQHGGDE